MAAAAAAAAAAQQQSQQQLRQQQLEEQAVLDAVRQDAVCAFDAEEAAAEVVNMVVDRATDVMIGNHLDRLAIPYTVRCVVKEALDFVRCAFVGRDDGHVTDAHWHVDPLAPRVTVDPWARAAVSVAEPRSKPLSQAEIDANTAAAVSASQSVSHVRRAPAGNSSKRPGGKQSTAHNASASVAGVHSTPNGSTATTKPTASGTHSGGTKKKESGKSGKGGAGHGAAAGSAAGTSEGGTPTPAMTLEEQEYLEAAKAEQRRRAEVRATHDRVARQLDEFKPGTNFTVDGATGKVMTISSFDGAGGRGRAPVHNESRYNIAAAPQAPTDLAPVKPPAGRRGNGPSSAPAALTSSTGSVLSPVANATATGGVGRSTRPKKPEASDFFHEEASYGPMIDTFAAAGGVMMRDKDAISKGGEVKVPKSKMTRAEYHKIASAQQSQPIDDGFDSPPAQIVVAQAAPSSDKGAARRVNQAGSSPQVPQVQQPRAAAADDFKTQSVASLPTHKRAGALAPLPGKGAASNETSNRASKREAAKQLAQTTPQRRRGGKAKLSGDAQFLLEDDE